MDITNPAGAIVRALPSGYSFPAVRSAFLSKLLAPLSDASEERSFQIDLRNEADFAWSEALHRYYAADAHRSVCSHRLHAVRLAGRLKPRLQKSAAEQQAWLDFLSALNALMLVPAPTIGALRMKQKHRKADGGRDRWEAAIAANEARLANLRDRRVKSIRGTRRGTDDAR